MGEQVVEKKVHSLGSWQTATVDNNVINAINNQIEHEKGSKVKLSLTAEHGLSVFGMTVMQGKNLYYRIPWDFIQCATVSQQMPDLLFVIATSRDPKYKKYQILAFRCKNSYDAGILTNALGSIPKIVQHKNAGLKTLSKSTEKETFGTHRSNERVNYTQELTKFVDLHGEKIVAYNTFEDTKHEREKQTVANNHTEVIENSIRIPLQYQQSRLGRASFASEHSDSRSDVSEKALLIDLESLSQGLRDTTLMREKTAGITVENSERDSSRKDKPVYMKTQHNIVVPEFVIAQQNDYKGEDGHNVVLIDGEPVHMRKKENSYTVIKEGNTTYVRLSAANYRSASERSTVHMTQSSGSERKDDETVQYRPKTMSYESWQRNSVQRNAAQYHDLPERIQWKSRSSQTSQFVARPRSVCSTWSTDLTGSAQMHVRHHPMSVGPGYQRVLLGKRMFITHNRQTHSLRARQLSTTVVKPIEKVYTGRSDAKHHSLRPTILIQDNIPYEGTSIVNKKNNNNTVHVDSDERPLAVNGN